MLTAAGAGLREGADTEDEEPDVEAVRGGHCAAVPVRREPEGRAGGEACCAASVLGRLPEGAGRSGAPRRRQSLASGERQHTPDPIFTCCYASVCSNGGTRSTGLAWDRPLKMFNAHSSES